MGEEEGKSFDVDKFINSHEVDTFYKDNAVSFFGGIPLTYGRFYEDRYTKRERRKKLAKNSQQDPSFRSEY